MNYRPLGSTGLVVSEVGFGAWGIGGTAGGAVSYGPVADDDALRALQRALDLGITFYDTADLYGHGHSERLLGKAFRGKRSAVVLASKVGLINARAEQDFSPEHIRTSIEGSLERLRTDHLDLYQLHDPPLELLRDNPRILDTMRSLQAEGKTRAIGISLRSPAEGRCAVEEFGFGCVQANFNMIDQRVIENGLLDLCGRRKVGFIARTPLCFGFLTGQYSQTSHFPAGDHRAAWPREQIALWAGAHQRFAAVVAAKQQTKAQLALRYCLSYPALSSVIPGMLSAAEVDENGATSRLGPLTESERGAVERIYRENTFFLVKNRENGTEHVPEVGTFVSGQS